MYSYPRPAVTPVDVLRILRRRCAVWLLPGIAGALLAGAFLRAMPFPWRATQTLMVRNEAVNTTQDGPGRFRQENEMKTIQETILEIARSRGVVLEALEDVGPPADRGARPDWLSLPESFLEEYIGTTAEPQPAEAWPSEQDIADAQDAIHVAPPKGTEFGKSEIFYLQVKHRDRDRAAALAAVICDRLQDRLGQVRSAKAAGLVKELAYNVELAQTELDAITGQLADLEQHVGGRDLADLRMLDQTGNGDSDLRRNLTTVEAELRDARQNRQIGLELLAALEAAQKDPTQIVATPNRLLESQPALRKLKEGLLEAQLRNAQLLGSFRADHPNVKTAQQAEKEIRRKLHDELAVAIRGLEVESRLAESRIAMLQEQLASSNSRLNELAALRADYSNLMAQSRHQNTLLEKARKDLADARGSQAAAETGSLISRLDVPSTGPRPVGPRKAVVILAGMLAGMAIGWGWIMLTEPAPTVPAGTSLSTVIPPRMSTIVTVGPSYTHERGLSLKQALWKIAHEGALSKTEG